GAPGFALADAVAPIAPDPLLPDGSAPVKLITVSDEVNICAMVAVTVTLLSGAVAKARHTSASPDCTLVRRTSCHVSPAPGTLVTLFALVGRPSAAMNASTNSLPALVENGLVAPVVAFGSWSTDVTVSTATPDAAVAAAVTRTA